MNTSGMIMPLSTPTTSMMSVGGSNSILLDSPSAINSSPHLSVSNTSANVSVLSSSPSRSPSLNYSQQSQLQQQQQQQQQYQQGHQASMGEESDEKRFMSNLYKFMESRGTPIEKIPIFDHKELNLYKLYNCVISRGGLESVIENKLWRQITNDLSVDPERTDAGFRLRIHYLKFLYPYERKNFLKSSDDENFDFDQFEKNLSKSPADKKLLNRKKKLQQQLTLNPPHHHHNSHNNNHHNSNSNSTSNSQQSQNHVVYSMDQQRILYSPSSNKSTPENSSPNSLISNNTSNSNNNNVTFSHNNSNNTNSTNNSVMSITNSNNSEILSEPSFLYNNSILASPMSPSSTSSTSPSTTNVNSTASNSSILNINNNNSNSNSNIVSNNINSNSNSTSFSFNSILNNTNLGNTTSYSSILSFPSNISAFNNNNIPSVNLQLLELKSLKKYNNYHKLKVSNAPSKKELLAAVLQHFCQQNVQEHDIINSFLKRIKSDTRIRPVERV